MHVADFGTLNLSFSLRKIFWLPHKVTLKCPFWGQEFIVYHDTVTNPSAEFSQHFHIDMTSSYGYWMMLYQLEHRTITKRDREAKLNWEGSKTKR